VRPSESSDTFLVDDGPRRLIEWGLRVQITVNTTGMRADLSVATDPHARDHCAGRLPSGTGSRIHPWNFHTREEHHHEDDPKKMRFNLTQAEGARVRDVAAPGLLSPRLLTRHFELRDSLFEHYGRTDSLDSLVILVILVADVDVAIDVKHHDRGYNDL